MHRKNLIAVVFVFMAASLLGAQSDGVWAPKGLAFINGLVIDPVTPSTIYASSGGGGGYAMFVSTDGGCNWSQLAALPLGDVQLLAIDPVTPTTLYAGWLNGYGGAVYKSIDSGSSWTRAGGLPCCFTPAALAIDPRIGTTLYLATASETAAYGGVFKSTDGGTTWMAAKVGLPSTAVSLVMDPRNPDTLYAGTWSGVFKTTDGGANWAQTALTSGYVDTLAIDPTTPTTVYASARDLRDSIIYKSTDGGTSWRESDSGLPNPRGVIDALVVDFHDLATVYAGSTLAGVFRSTDGGATWSSMNDGLTNLDIHELAIDTQVPATLYAGTWGSGVFATTITPRFLLTIEKMRDGNGVVSSTQSGINCGDDCSERYLSGTTLTLSATAAQDSVFTGWRDCDAVADDGTCTVTMDRARTVMAGFDLRRFTLSVLPSRTGGGTVVSNPGGIDCGSYCSEIFVIGTTVTLTATPEHGTVKSWSGCDTDSGHGRVSRCTVAMTGDRAVMATLTGPRASPSSVAAGAGSPNR